MRQIGGLIDAALAPIAPPRCIGQNNRAGMVEHRDLRGNGIKNGVLKL